MAQVHYVYQQPKGDARLEIGGVAVCLLGYAAAAGVDLLDVIHAELARIEVKPIDEIRGSLARKNDADLIHGDMPTGEQKQ